MKRSVSVVIGPTMCVVWLAASCASGVPNTSREVKAPEPSETREVIPPPNDSQIRARDQARPGLLVAQARPGGSGMEVEAEGVAAVIENDQIGAKAQALDNAKRRAVEDGVGTFLASETLTENYSVIEDRIFTRASGFVSDVKKLSESCDETACTVKIRARVSLVPISSVISQLRLIMDGLGQPSVALMIEEVELPRHARGPRNPRLNGTVATKLYDLLTEQGFQLMDLEHEELVRQRDSALAAARGDNHSAAAIASDMGADVVIRGTVKVSEQDAVFEGSYSYRGVFDVKVLWADTGRVITGLTGEGDANFDFNRGPTIQKASESAATKIGEDLVSKLIKPWNDRIINGRTYHLLLIGVEDIGHYDDFMERLAEIPGVKRVDKGRFTEGAGRGQVVYRGKIDRLSKEIRAIDFDDFKPRITSRSGTKMAVKLRPKG